MRPSLIITIIICGAVWLQAASATIAQQPPRSASLAESRTGSTVSPYLNLGINSNGLSNYSTLVRPLLNQRELLARQALTKQRLSAPPEEETGRRVSRRFMNYSHYFDRGR
jgi:hypothetical protein